MKLVCNSCGRDINALGQDNVSYTLEKNLCEDCANGARLRSLAMTFPKGLQESNDEDEEI